MSYYNNPSMQQPQPIPYDIRQAPQLHQPDYTDYPLKSSSDRLKHKVNIMRFPKPVDPSNFTPPVKLYRGDPNAPHPSTVIHSIVAANSGASASSTQGKVGGHGSSPATSGADTSLIAPYGGATRNKQMLFKKRTKQIYIASEDSRKLKIEEDKPWILTDFDGHNTWIGELEGGLQAAYCLFMLTDRGFKVVPIDRWYKFKPKIKHRTLTIEEAEDALQKAQKRDQFRWMMRNFSKQTEEEDTAKEGGVFDTRSQLKTVDHYESDDEEGRRAKNEEYDEEMDFEEVFEDDEEAPDIAKDEEEIEVENKMKKSIRKATVEHDEDVDDGEGQEELTSTGKDMKRLVRQLENNDAYGSDMEEDPYASSVEEDDSEAEDNNGTAQKPPAVPPIAAKSPATATKSTKPPASTAKKTKAANKAGTSGPETTSKKQKSSGKRIQSDTTKAPPAKKAKGMTKGSTTGSSNAVIPPDIVDPITEDEVVSLISKGGMTTKDLCDSLRPKIKSDPRNRDILLTWVRKVSVIDKEKGENTLLIRKNSM